VSNSIGSFLPNSVFSVNLSFGQILEKIDMSITYKGKRKFDKNQLVLMVNVAMEGAMDRIESYLPQGISDEDKRDWNERSQYFNAHVSSCIETMGMTIAILYAQLTDDGLGIGDVIEASGIESVIEKMTKKRLSPRWKGPKVGERCSPDTEYLAKKFVKEFFSEYLNGVSV
jgi:hypothetical protein